MQRLRRRFTKTGAVVVTIVAALVLLVGTALAAFVEWDGNNGATGGLCNTVNQDPTVPAGQQRWLFILTQPDAGPTWTMTAVFNPPAITPMPVSGVQQGGGSVHFTVFTPLGAQLVSASTNDGTDKSNLTVNHCDVTPTTTTSSTTTTTGPATT